MNIGHFSAAGTRWRNFAKVQGEELKSNILSQNFALVVIATPGENTPRHAVLNRAGAGGRVIVPSLDPATYGTMWTPHERDDHPSETRIGSAGHLILAINRELTQFSFVSELIEPI